MSQVIKRDKPLSVNPLKASAPMGAALAFLGVRCSIPMLHGSQGCTAFAKVFFVRHFREPIPLQTTAMDQISTIMSADENVLEGLATICAKSAPALIGLPTTGLSETQGTDILRVLKQFRAQHPEFEAIPIVAVNTPDYSGCLESGYAAAVRGLIDVLVPEEPDRRGRRPHQVNILAGSMLTPGDIEHVKELVEAFGLSPVVVPDIGDSLDGHLMPEEFSPLTIGGTPVEEIGALGEARATLVIGRSLEAAATLLRQRTGVPDHRFDTLMGLDAVDAFVHRLSEISGRPVPQRIERQRAQLQDAMVDTHFMFGFARVAVAADPDLLLAMSQLIRGMGAEVVAAVAPARAPSLDDVAAAEIRLGDLEDLESAARRRRAKLIIGNSHAAESARRLGLPIMRMGFPQYDLVGGYQKTWVGYGGTRQTLFDLANLVLEHHGQHEIKPYRSRFSTKADDPERGNPAAAAPAAAGGAPH